MNPNKKLASILALLFGFFANQIVAQNGFVPLTNTIDFGNVYDDVIEVRYELKYVNTGHFPLTVEHPIEFFDDVYTSTDTVAPGDTGTFLIRCETAYRGNLNETIIIETNEIVDSLCTGRIIYQEYPIYVTGRVIEKPHPKLECDGIDFGIVEVNEDSGVRLLKCLNEGEKNLLITSITTSDSIALISFPTKPIAPGEIFYIKYNRSKLTEGHFYDILYIHTNEINYIWNNSVFYLIQEVPVEGKLVNLN